MLVIEILGNYVFYQNKYSPGLIIDEKYQTMVQKIKDPFFVASKGTNLLSESDGFGHSWFLDLLNFTHLFFHNKITRNKGARRFRHNYSRYRCLTVM